VYFGSFSAGLPNGSGRLIRADGKVERGTWKDGQLQAPRLPAAVRVQ
jgi:hypothetical protein